MKPFELKLIALFATSALAHAEPQTPFLGNEIQPSDGGTNIVVLSNPSVAGDALYKCVPASRMRSCTGTLDFNTIEDLFVGTSDWPGDPPFLHDLVLSTASAPNPLDPLAPDILTTGTGVLALISIGSTGLPNPCMVDPTTPGCPVCPFLGTGYVLDISFGSPITLPAPAVSSDTEGLALVALAPPGMVFNPTGTGTGTCGNGDYVFVGSLSTSENQADYLNVTGASWGTGLKFGAGAPAPTTTNVMAAMNFGFIENVIEAEVSDPSVPFGPVRGGASLGVDTSSGSVQLAAHVTAAPGLGGFICFPAMSLTPLPQGLSVFGACTLIAPDAVFSNTLSAWAGTGGLIPVDETGDGVFDQAEAVSVTVPVPSAPGVRGHLQAFIITGVGPITATETTSFAIDFL